MRTEVKTNSRTPPIVVRWSLLLAVTIALGACSSPAGGDQNPEDGDTTEEASGGTVVTVNEEVDVYEETDAEETDDSMSASSSLTASAKRGPGMGNGRTEVSDFDYTITRIARITPVTVGGKSVQAADITLSGNTAAVAYNRAGEPFAGGVQIVDVTDSDNPEVTWEVFYADRDINVVMIHDKTLYFGGAKEPANNTDPSIEPRSFITSVNLDDPDTADASENEVFLPSYGVTGIAQHGNAIYATAGAEDGVLARLTVNSSALEPDQTVERSDLRDLEAYQNGVIALAGTTDVGDNETDTQAGVLIYRKQSLEDPLLLPIVEFGSDYGKASIEVYQGQTALLGLSQAGLKILDLRNDESADTVSFVYEEENPVASWTEKTTTNSVSTQGALIFSANGEYGFRVLRVQGSLANGGTVETVGFVSFEDHPVDGTDHYWSANHVVAGGDAGDGDASDKTHLLVASGLGGVNVYTVNKER